MKIGDKVVNIGRLPSHPDLGGKPIDFRFPQGFPVVGAVYVIRGFYLSQGQHLGLHLVGLSAIHIASGVETGFYSEEYRLLDEVKSANKNKDSHGQEKQNQET